MDSAKVECGVCGAEVEVAILVSTNQFGHPDLDCRPPPMARGTMGFWVQECSACGYCAADITKATPEEQAICRGRPFQEFRSSLGKDPRLARSFMTAAFVASQNGDHIGALNLNLFAAWVYDDLHAEKSAGGQRMVAAECLTAAHSVGSRRFDDAGSDEALLVDMLRRAGEFERASEVCREALSQSCNDNVRQVLEYEMFLCEREDSARHTMGDVAKPGGESDPQESFWKKVLRKLNSPL